MLAFLELWLGGVDFVRLRIVVRTRADSVPWREVLRPGRGLAYRWLSAAAPDLSERLHAQGCGAHRLAPFGHGAPSFPAARRRRGVYAAGGLGVVEFGSPLVAVVEAWAEALSGVTLLDWGGVALQVERVEVVEPPSLDSGVAAWRTATPVVMKGSGRDEDGVRVTRQAHLLPGDAEFGVYFAGNLRRKAEVLGLDPSVSLERIDWVGAKRSFAVKDGLRPGARVGVVLRGAPETLRALWSWGLGQANSAGFGWVAA